MENGGAGPRKGERTFSSGTGSFFESQALQVILMFICHHFHKHSIRSNDFFSPKNPVRFLGVVHHKTFNEIAVNLCFLVSHQAHQRNGVCELVGGGEQLYGTVITTQTKITSKGSLVV